MHDTDSIPTRQSLLARLKNWENQESWREFFDTYWRLIHAAALRAGLNETEAQEVVQEVMIAAAKKMPGFTYDPAKDSLKGWLLALTRWKVLDQFRKRDSKEVALGDFAEPQSTGLVSLEPTGRSKTVSLERFVARNDWERLWNSDWRQNRLRAAMDRVKRSANPAHYEMYHLHVLEGLSASETARLLCTNTAAVHLAKHRVGKLVKAEIKRLEAKEEPPCWGK